MTWKGLDLVVAVAVGVTLGLLASALLNRPGQPIVPETVVPQPDQE